MKNVRLFLSRWLTFACLSVWSTAHTDAFMSGYDQKIHLRLPKDYHPACGEKLAKGHEMVERKEEKKDEKLCQ